MSGLPSVVILSPVYLKYGVFLSLPIAEGNDPSLFSGHSLQNVVYVAFFLSLLLTTRQTTRLILVVAPAEPETALLRYSHYVIRISISIKPSILYLYAVSYVPRGPEACRLDQTTLHRSL